MIAARRGFLKAMALAPAALPVAAKAAAKKMGLSDIASAGANAPHLVGHSGSSIRSDASWAKEALNEMMSAGAVKDRMNQARQNARVLDADLAASRSMSPSVAYGIQVDRCYKRLTEDQKSYFIAEIERATKRAMGLS